MDLFRITKDKDTDSPSFDDSALFEQLLQQRYPDAEKPTLVKQMHSRDPLLSTRKSSSVSVYQSSYPFSDFMNAYEVRFIFGLLLRFNSQFRVRIQWAIEKFRASSRPYFSAEERCVAAHIRMHDRTQPGVDMAEWCSRHTRYDESNRRTWSGDGLWVDGSPLTEAQWLAMGCDTPAPYGALRLEHYINASRNLLSKNVNTLFIMTDDHMWVEKELRKYRLDEQLLSTAPHHRQSFQEHQSKVYREMKEDEGSYASDSPFSPSRSVFFHGATTSDHPLHIHVFPARNKHRESSSTEVAVDFWASITIAQQCEGFVGHFASNAANLVYHAMCFLHGASEVLICPPLYNIGGF